MKNKGLMWAAALALMLAAANADAGNFTFNWDTDYRQNTENNSLVSLQALLTLSGNESDVDNNIPPDAFDKWIGTMTFRQRLCANGSLGDSIINPSAFYYATVFVPDPGNPAAVMKPLQCDAMSINGLTANLTELNGTFDQDGYWGVYSCWGNYTWLTNLEYPTAYLSMGFTSISENHSVFGMYSPVGADMLYSTPMAYQTTTRRVLTKKFISSDESYSDGACASTTSSTSSSTSSSSSSSLSVIGNCTITVDVMDANTQMVISSQNSTLGITTVAAPLTNYVYDPVAGFSRVYVPAEYQNSSYITAYSYGYVSETKNLLNSYACKYSNVWNPIFYLVPATNTETPPPSDGGGSAIASFVMLSTNGGSITGVNYRLNGNGQQKTGQYNGAAIYFNATLGAEYTLTLIPNVTTLYSQQTAAPHIFTMIDEQWAAQFTPLISQVNQSQTFCSDFTAVNGKTGAAIPNVIVTSTCDSLNRLNLLTNASGQIRICNLTYLSGPICESRGTATGWNTGYAIHMDGDPVLFNMTQDLTGRTKTITVIVKASDTGAGLSGADVSLYTASTAKANGQTNAAGFKAFAQQYENTIYLVDASKTGYMTALSQTIPASASGITITLQKLPSNGAEIPVTVRNTTDETGSYECEVYRDGSLIDRFTTTASGTYTWSNPDRTQAYEIRCDIDGVTAIIQYPAFGWEEEPPPADVTPPTAEESAVDSWITWIFTKIWWSIVIVLIFMFLVVALFGLLMFLLMGQALNETIGKLAMTGFGMSFIMLALIVILIIFSVIVPLMV